MVNSVIVQALLVILDLSLAIPLDSDGGISPYILPSSPTPDLNRLSTSSSPENQPFYPHQTTATSSSASSLLASSGNDPRTVNVSVVLTTDYITLPPSTKTETTILVSTVTALTAPYSITPSARPEPSPLQTTWSAPSQMTDLSSLKITYFPSGQQNVKLVSSLPYVSSRTSNEEDQSLLQVLYPAHSINPARNPVGGASFYASPLELSSATNVSLQYSIFFPTDFNWVRGGKLPGLYGGRTGCSGGTDAKDCFSTRLMWRSGGIGELYLYAPKDRQPDSLCSSPGSRCNADYGFSIGRGSFMWTGGAWTNVSQTIVLNTGGKANGWFTLHINGKLAIDRRDIYYRDGGGDQQFPQVKPTKTVAEMVTKSHNHATVTTTSHGGLLGDLFNPLLGHTGASKRFVSGDLGAHYKAPHWFDRLQGLFSINSNSRDGQNSHSHSLADVEVKLPLISAGANIGDDGAQVSVDVGGIWHGDNNEDSEREKQPVGLIGIFFSTFFGGHDDKYATPKDQYVWFKELSLTINV